MTLTPQNAASLLTLAVQEWNTGTNSLGPQITLTYGVDYKLITEDPAQRVKRIVFLKPADGSARFARNGVWRLTVDESTANRFGSQLGLDQSLDFSFLIADANNDGAVNFSDLVILSQHYEMPTTNPNSPRMEGDLNCDGVIDFEDLVLLSQMYNDVLP